jgi:hypothetical protein
MEIMHQHLHGRCCVGKPEKIHRTGEVKEPWNCYSTLLFLHRGALISKSVVPVVEKVLDETIKMVKYMKSRLITVEVVFSMGAAYTQLLLHKEVRWLSRGLVLPRFCELREQLSRLMGLSWLTWLVMRPGAMQLPS